jgi:protocatechuate 3,4-dioxygenase beta subunit
MTITAVSSSSTATIKINGTTVATGVPSAAVALALGTTTITVAVTAADNTTTRTYTIAVTRSDTVASSCTGQQRIPNETAGPYPGDGTNGPNVLVMSGVIRSDIRSSFGGMSGTAPGVPLTVILRLVSASTCQPLAGYAVYLWHCTRDGGYSLYTSGFTSQNYLRGIQDADASGQVTFQTIYPGCYSGRWPHIHFEVFPSLSTSNSAGNKVATSQRTLRDAHVRRECQQVFKLSSEDWRRAYCCFVQRRAGFRLCGVYRGSAGNGDASFHSRNSQRDRDVECLSDC